MAKPKKKQTKTCKRNRRAHFSIDTKILATCEKCGTKVLPHRACVKCGNYKGRSVFEKVYDKVVSSKAVETKEVAEAKTEDAPKTEKKVEKKETAKKESKPVEKKAEEKAEASKDDAEKSAA